MASPLGWNLTLLISEVWPWEWMKGYMYYILLIIMVIVVCTFLLMLGVLFTIVWMYCTSKLLWKVTLLCVNESSITKSVHSILNIWMYIQNIIRYYVVRSTLTYCKVLIVLVSPPSPQSIVHSLLSAYPTSKQHCRKPRRAGQYQQVAGYNLPQTQRCLG